MTPETGHPKIPDLKLEQFLLGELTPEETRRIQQQLESDEILRERLEALKRSDLEIIDRYTVHQVATGIREKLERSTELKKTGRLNLWPVPALSAAAAVLVAVLIFSPPWEWSGEQPEIAIGTRTKGLDPQILLFRKTDTGSEQLENGATAGEHDLILIQYIAAGEMYGAVFSVDGRGTLTRHAPLEGAEPLQLQQEGAISLGFSYELDDAPRWEKFYFVSSDSLFALDTVFAAAQDSSRGARGDTLQLPQDIHQSIFTLEKEASHE